MKRRAGRIVTAGGQATCLALALCAALVTGAAQPRLAMAHAGGQTDLYVMPVGEGQQEPPQQQHMTVSSAPPGGQDAAGSQPQGGDQPSPTTGDATAAGVPLALAALGAAGVMAGRARRRRDDPPPTIARGNAQADARELEP